MKNTWEEKKNTQHNQEATPDANFLPLCNRLADTLGNANKNRAEGRINKRENDEKKKNSASMHKQLNRTLQIHTKRTELAAGYLKLSFSLPLSLKKKKNRPRMTFSLPERGSRGSLSIFLCLLQEVYEVLIYISKLYICITV